MLALRLRYRPHDYSEHSDSAQNHVRAALTFRLRPDPRPRPPHIPTRQEPLPHLSSVHSESARKRPRVPAPLLGGTALALLGGAPLALLRRREHSEEPDEVRVRHHPQRRPARGPEVTGWNTGLGAGARGGGWGNGCSGVGGEII